MSLGLSGFNIGMMLGDYHLISHLALYNLYLLCRGDVLSIEMKDVSSWPLTPSCPQALLVFILSDTSSSNVMNQSVNNGFLLFKLP